MKVKFTDIVIFQKNNILDLKKHSLKLYGLICYLKRFLGKYKRVFCIEKLSTTFYNFYLDIYCYVILLLYVTEKYKIKNTKCINKIFIFFNYLKISF